MCVRIGWTTSNVSQQSVHRLLGSFTPRRWTSWDGRPYDTWLRAVTWSHVCLVGELRSPTRQIAGCAADVDRGAGPPHAEQTDAGVFGRGRNRPTYGTANAHTTYARAMVDGYVMPYTQSLADMVNFTCDWVIFSFRSRSLRWYECSSSPKDDSRAQEPCMFLHK